MIEVPMVEDIRKFETKIAGPFTLRQIICLVIGLVIALPVGLLLPLEVSDKLMVILFVAAPILLCGWIKMDNCNAEVIFLRFLYKTVLAPPKRKNIAKSSWKEDYEKMLKKEKQEKISQNGGKQGKPEQIQYSNKEKYRIYT